MAHLTPSGRWSAIQTRSQFAAIAWLRWRITVNSLRRQGTVGELIARIFLYLIFAAITLFFVVGAASVAFYFASGGQLAHILWLLWATFVLCQFLNIQLGQPATTFDPTQLSRFPLRLHTYAAMRLFFGILSPANIVASVISLAIAVGIATAIPSLSFYAFAALTIFAITNIFFSRMIFAWVDRWLSARRAREVFTGLIFAFSLAIQWANLNFNSSYYGVSEHHYSRLSPQQLHRIIGIYSRAQPLLAVLPPELTSASLVSAYHHNLSSFLTHYLACILFAILFLGIFALRMRTEFRGESLSNAAPGSSTFLPQPSFLPSTQKLVPSTFSSDTYGISPVIPILFGKELLYLRRHLGILYGLLMPILLVLLFASRFSSDGRSRWIFPAAVGYTLLAIAPLSYNAFGFEATGSQLYFLAPIRMRDVLLAKNLFSFLMAFVEILVVFAIITYISGLPSLQTSSAAALWAIGTLAINAVFGNRRSFTDPKKINPVRIANKQTSQLSALISLGILAVSYATASGLFLLCENLRASWLILPLALLFSTIGILIYIQALRSLDCYALAHREQLFAELCKQA